MAADTPASAPATPSHAAMQQAAEWFALLRSGEASAQQRTDWQAWLAQAAEHRDAWAYAEAVGQRFAPMRERDNRQAAAAALKQVRAQRGGRRQLLRGVALLAGTGLLGWTGWRHSPVPQMALAWSADYRSATGELREMRLADGTHIWLNTATAFNADYQPQLRRVALVAGEILITTGSDARPFVADTRHGRLRALGTRFTVRLEEHTTLLAVYQGAVELRTASGNALRVIRAGEQARFDGERVHAVMPAEATREAWTRGVLLAEDITLQALVAELNRYHHGHLGVAPEVAGLRVLGGYPLRDLPRTLAMLEAVLPIRVQRSLPWWASIEPSSKSSSAAR